jgi:hypothetical protein
MNPSVRNSLYAVAILALVGAGFYFLKHEKPVSDATMQTSAPVVAAPASVANTESEGARYPVPVASKKALPAALDESDSLFDGAFSELIGESAFDSLFVSDDLIRRVVMMVDNATESEFILDLVPYKSLPTAFSAKRTGDQYWLDTGKNVARYQPYMALLDAANVKKVADLYFHFYPLLQVAYRELKPEGHFNDRVVEVIDHLSQTPEIATPVELQKLTKSYKYIDPKLEDLSASQKLLLRMGAENTKKIKAKLKAFREIIILGQ